MEIAKLWTRSFDITDLSGVAVSWNHRTFALQQPLVRVSSLDDQEIVDDKIGDITTQPVTRGQVKAIMLSAKLRLRSANSLALCAVDSWRPAEAVCAISFQ